MSIKAYLFDFDGTLVDSMPTFVSCMLRILDENNIPYEPDIIKVLTPLGLEGCVKHFISMGLNMPPERIALKIKEYLMEAYLYHIPAKENVISTLQTLKQRGAKLNILTASPHITLDPCLKRLGMYDLFDNVWSCDDFATTKADPEIYRQVAKRLGERVEDILFLDDNLNADRTAKSAGMQVCGVYDDSSREYVSQMQAENDYYIFEFSELLTIQ